MEYSDKINKKIQDSFNVADNNKPINQIPLIKIKNKILLVDDDELLHNMYAMKFEKNGFEVRVASGGEEAIKIIKDGYIPDIFITDIMMPNMDGLTIFEVIKKEKLAPNAVAIALTNKGLSTEINRAKEGGFHGYIVKATTIPADVVEEVKKICRNYCTD